MASVKDAFAQVNPNDRTLPGMGVKQETPRQQGCEAVAVGDCPRNELPEGYYLVEAIRCKRVINGKKQYKIKWRDYPETDNTWEPLKNLRGISYMIDAFEKSICKHKGKRVACGTQHRKWQQPSTTASVADVGDAIVEIIDIKYLSPPENYTDEPFVIFSALKSSGAKVVVSNRTLKKSNPLLLANYYEQIYVLNTMQLELGIEEEGR
ncbi:hypothetical protein L6164_002787 [Bauhinia variegata]|uniref:Uncharacterized protein n=1 Tax=Bauhinia variegata TaxID=167791 RepID=A0ACB9PYF8_BAUVA|nr:hypothetical protein L6164_002787 [Bauhinia variegata]